MRHWTKPERAAIFLLAVAYFVTIGFVARMAAEQYQQNVETIQENHHGQRKDRA